MRYIGRLSIHKLWSCSIIYVCFINLALFCGFHMINSSMAFFVLELGGDEAMAGLAAGLYSISAVLMRPVVGWTLDNKGRRGTMLFGLLGLTCVFCGYAFSSSILLVMLLRVLQGLTWAGGSTAINTTACDIIPLERFSEGMGMFGLTSAFSSCVAPMLGLAIMNDLGFKTMFLIAMGIELVAFLLALRAPTYPIPTNSQKLAFRHSLKALMNVEALPGSLTMFCFLLAYGCIATFVAVHAVDAGIVENGGLFFTCMAVTVALMRLLVGRVSDRVGEGPMVYIGNACGIGCMALLAFFPNQLCFILAALLFGAGFGMLSPALQAMAMRTVTPERRGSASSTFLCAYDIGIGLGGVIAGFFVRAWDYQTMFGIAILFLLASLGIYWFWARHTRSAFRIYTAQK